MIYESAIVLRAESDESTIAKFKEQFSEVVKSFEGEVLITDDWGVKKFGQPTTNGVGRGNYIYFMFKANSEANKELERRFRINENLLKYVIIKLGDETKQEALVKAYVRPGSNAESEGTDKKTADKEKRLFAKKRTCWFTANKTSPDWKDPMTYSWLVNEFGKISPARITGLSPKFQRKANNAIKIGRNIGLISYVSNQIAR